MSIRIGAVQTRNPVFLAPMSGVTDEAFRRIAHDCGAGLVVSEMVASEELAKDRADMVRRARGHRSVSPFVIQLAGRETRWMAEGARLAQDLGADIIDINMGCPARQVTGGLSGSALMRDPDHAIALVAATVAASRVPVTLKMRLGWDEKSLNAPDIARRAEEAGVQMVTIHGRTRCQFYTGRADWKTIRRVKEAVRIPVVANGDCETVADARSMLEASGADGVMVGRAAYGRPWWPGVLAHGLDSAHGKAAPTLEMEAQLLLQHQAQTIDLYGERLGNRTFRKHFGWAIGRLLERKLIAEQFAASARQAYLAQPDNALVRSGIVHCYDSAIAQQERVAA